MYLQLIWAALFDDLSNSKTDNVDDIYIYIYHIYIYNIRNVYEWTGIPIQQAEKFYFWCIKYGKLPKEWLKSKQSPFFKEIHRPVTWNLTFEIILQNKHISRVLVMPNYRNQRQRKQKR